MLRLSDYAKMGPEEQRRALHDLMAKPNGARLEAQVRELEQRYEMTSETMRARAQRGEIDTADTARWLVLLGAVGR